MVEALLADSTSSTGSESSFQTEAVTLYTLEKIALLSNIEVEGLLIVDLTGYLSKLTYNT